MTTETSAQLRAQAQEIRDRAAELRAQEQAVLAAGQAEADRLRAKADRVFAEARTEANRLMNEAGHVERTAEPVEQRALLLQAAEELVTAIPAAEQRVVDLYQEAEALGEQISSLQARLGKLGEDREEVGVQLAKARDAGDVDDVTQLRIRLGAIDEVTAALTGQKRTAEQRVVAIGAPDDDKELGRAAELVVKMRAQERQVLNQLDPTRYEAQVDAAIDQARDYIAWAVEQQEKDQADAARRPNTIVRN